MHGDSLLCPFAMCIEVLGDGEFQAVNLYHQALDLGVLALGFCLLHHVRRHGDAFGCGLKRRVELGDVGVIGVHGLRFLCMSSAPHSEAPF